MKRIAISLLLAVIAFCAFPQLLTAQQGLPVDGKDFYIGYVYPSFNKNSSSNGRDTKGFFAVYALISSYDQNQVTVSYFDPVNGNPSDGYETQKSTFSIFAKQAIQVPLSSSMMQMSEPGDIPEYKACHITSKKPVNVQYFSTGACSGGSYLAIPTPALGQKYVVPSYFDNPGIGNGQSSQGELSAGFFLIIGAFNGTNVKITPNNTTTGGHQGVHTGKNSNGSPAPYNITLSRGQCYWVKGDGTDDANDMSGSTVESDKPVGLLAGHENAFLGDAPTSRILEGRDFMIEQVIPSEYWDSTGYVSIPLIDAQPLDESSASYGENYRVYTNDPRGAGVVLDDAGQGTGIDMPVGKYSYPTPERFNVANPVDFHSKDGHKFGVMMYDLRGQGTKQPYPCESMMSIVPMSRWRTSYLFYVPANTFEVLQNYYINVIGLKTDIDNGWIKFSVNGAPNLTPIKSLAPKSYNNIPNHPELKGIRVSVAPGAYFLTNTRTKIDSNSAVDMALQGAFMVYHYGMRAIDPDRDLGDFCGDDFFFSYALPIGMTVSSGSGHPVVHVDTFCNHWHVTVHDSVALTSATLIDDPDGNVYGRPGKVYKNVYFDFASDPDDKKEVVFNGIDTAVSFDIYVANPLDTAYAPLYIVDKKGYHLVPILELRYKAPDLGYGLEPNLTQKIDTILYPTIKVGQQVCSTLVYYNKAKIGGKNLLVQSAKLQKNDGSFVVLSTTPSLPTTLNPGDSLLVQLCFSAKDTSKYEDSVILTTDCIIAPLPTLGRGATPLIYATDWDFGEVTVGATKCNTVTITNRGSLPFVLTKDQFTSSVFTLDPNYANRLPHTLKPGESIVMGFCYSPTKEGPPDTTTVDWVNDIDAPFKGQIKPWSLLTGRPIKPGLVWDRPTQLDSVICEDFVEDTVHLINNSNALAKDVKVSFKGPDALEYTIVTDQLGYVPLKNFDMAIGKDIWVLVRFKADLTKTGAAKYANRHANLVAEYANELTGSSDSVLIEFTGKVQHAELTFNPQLLNFGFVTRGQSNTGYVTVVDTGDAPFVVKSVSFPGPITGISINGKALAAGDTIHRGDTVVLAIDNQLDVFADTTVNYTLFSDHSCGDFTASVQSIASSLRVLGTGYPAPNVFVGCRQHDSSIVFTNKGSVQIKLVSVDIATPNPVGQFELVDPTGNKGTSVTFVGGKTLNFNDSVVIPIIYHPTTAGSATATIVYTYDSAGTKFTLTKQASGVGVQLKTTLSAEQPGGAPYTANTGLTFNVPVSITTTALPQNADVRSISFNLTYTQDVVNFIDAAPSSALYTIVGNPGPVAIGNGKERISYTISSPTQITNLENIVQSHFRVMVAQPMTTQFVVSDVKFYDGGGNVICYVAADTIPGVFVPNYLCGDTTLHKYLQGVLPTRIAALSPSIVGDNEDPILYYGINRADLPVRVEIYNVLGERVRVIKNTASQPTGEYKLPIGTRGLTSGTYTVRLVTPISAESANFILQK
jgi:hypothetical protein